MKDEYLTPSEVAKILKVSSRTVLNMIRDKSLRAICLIGNKRKRYRILSGELDRFVAEEYEKLNEKGE